MEQVKLTILGSGSALPSGNSFPCSQILEWRNKQFMIDCGEGAQIRIRQAAVKSNRLGHIFISHLHGDHCFGLIGLISSFGMLNRTADLYIHSHGDLKKLMQKQLDYFCTELPFNIYFEPFHPKKNETIYEDRTISVSTIPLKHRVPTAGFLFREKQKDRHIKRDMIDFYEIPVWKIPKIKQGADFETASGEIIPNRLLTTPPDPAKSYAYCSDTMYFEKIIPIIQDVDCLYHEATFASTEAVRAQKTMHSTAGQAGKIARKANVKKLIIGHCSARYKTHQQLLTEATNEFENTALAEDMKSFYF
ncbi:MAG: ribonuclease Z [Prevotellaceae bacterium]|jgi:ribonuclease Z|nr:ribonuclease Z [Prevotellaceae bacterium]